MSGNPLYVFFFFDSFLFSLFFLEVVQWGSRSRISCLRRTDHGVKRPIPFFRGMAHNFLQATTSRNVLLYT